MEDGIGTFGKDKLCYYNTNKIYYWEDNEFEGWGIVSTTVQVSLLGGKGKMHNYSWRQMNSCGKQI